jgi:hypothetical protein
MKDVVRRIECPRKQVHASFCVRFGASFGVVVYDFKIKNKSRIFICVLCPRKVTTLPSVRVFVRLLCEDSKNSAPPQKRHLPT